MLHFHTDRVCVGGHGATPRVVGRLNIVPAHVSGGQWVTRGQGSEGGGTGRRCRGGCPHWPLPEQDHLLPQPAAVLLLQHKDVCRRGHNCTRRLGGEITNHATGGGGEDTQAWLRDGTHPYTTPHTPLPPPAAPIALTNNEHHQHNQDAKGQHARRVYCLHALPRPIDNEEHVGDGCHTQTSGPNHQPAEHL
jgi:hypothetical protein